MTLAVRAQVILPFNSGLPTDISTNTWSFFALTDPPDPVADFENLRTHLNDFYSSITGELSPVINGGAAHVRFYGGTSFSVPLTFLEDDPMPIGGIGGVGYPQEVALCLSFAGVSALGGGTTNPQNRRGRLYIGPLNRNTGEVGVGGRVEPLAATCTDIATAAHDFSVALAADGVFQWVVHSRTTGGAATPVTHGWVDNEFDTVRSRGGEADFRSTFVA